MADVQKQMRDVDANLQSHAYDLSERHLFTLKAGMCDPVANWQVVPGDYFEIDPFAFMRTQKLQTAAFARMRLHLDFFFVPYWQLWHQFPQMKYQRQDATSATQYNNFGKLSPWMSLRALYAQVLRATESANSGTSYINTDLDAFGYSKSYNSVRLCDMLGYGSLRNMLKPMRDAQTNEIIGAELSPVPDGGYASQHVNIWPWLAYQKIWSDFYRNDLYDVAVDPRNFNVDDVDAATVASGDIYAKRHPSGSPSGTYYGFNGTMSGIFELRYRQWKKDYFTGLFPDKQFGDVSQVVGSSPLTFRGQNGYLPASQGDLEFVGSNTPSNAGQTVLQGGTWPDNLAHVVSGISAIDIRRAELLQIWKEKTLRAGNRTENQQRAHFGVISEYIPDDHVRHIGGCSQLLDVNEVISTSLNNTGLAQDATGHDGLGELGGKGTCFCNGNKIRFHVKDDGLIMCIASVLPESSYAALGLQHCHTRIDPFDYFTPAFQNLGFEAVTRAELDNIAVAAGGQTAIVGYAPPYYDLKMGVDKVHGEFIPQSAADILSSGYIWTYQNNNAGSLKVFDSARREASARIGTLPFFYVDPHVLDSIFMVDADSQESTDQFWIAAYFSIKAVRPISVLGLPNF